VSGMRRDFGVTERREEYQEWNEQLRMWEAVTGGNGRVASGFDLSAVSKTVWSAWCDIVNQALRILRFTRNLKIKKVIEEIRVTFICQETFLPRGDISAKRCRVSSSLS